MDIKVLSARKIRMGFDCAKKFKFYITGLTVIERGQISYRMTKVFLNLEMPAIYDLVLDFFMVGGEVDRSKITQVIRKIGDIIAVYVKQGFDIEESSVFVLHNKRTGEVVVKLIDLSYFHYGNNQNLLISLRNIRLFFIKLLTFVQKSNSKLLE